MLCQMHPAKSAYVQSLAISNCKHPTLALSLALDAEENRLRQALGKMTSDKYSYSVVKVISLSSSLPSDVLQIAFLRDGI